MSETTTSAAEKRAVKQAEAEVDKAAKAREKKIETGQCVVDENFHVGRAVNGLVCSYHAMHYDAYGNRRS